MFTCPENDIHSIYLDNELPENFKAEYESHIKQCPKCKAKLEALRKNHMAFQADSQQLELSQEFLDASFERLQSRMRYAKNSANANNGNTTMFPNRKKYIPLAIAAAAVFAIVLPVSFRTKEITPETVSVIKTIKRTTNFSLNQNKLLTEASDNTYPVQLNTSSPYVEQTFSLDFFNPSSEFAMQKLPVRKVVKNSFTASELLSDDFFYPDFAQNDDTMLQVYMPSYVDISSLSE